MSSSKPFQIIYQIKDQIQVESIQFEEENLIETQVVNFDELKEDEEDIESQLVIDLDDNKEDVMFETKIDVIDLIEEEEDDDVIEIKQEPELVIIDEESEEENAVSEVLEPPSELLPPPNPFDYPKYVNSNATCKYCHLNPVYKKHFCKFCKICKILFPSKYLAQRHKKHHHEIYTCDLCGEKMNQRLLLLLHILEKHKEGYNPLIDCELCESESFRHSESLRIHLHLVHNEIDCKKCKMRLNFHNNQHYKCHECHQIFKSRTIMKNHFKTHWEPEIFGCIICGCQFNQQKFLKIHCIKAHYQPNERWFCDFCTYSTRTEEYFLKHKKRHEIQLSNLERKKNWSKCEICGILVRNKLKLSSHKWRAHRNEMIG